MFGWPLILLTGVSFYLLKDKPTFGPRKVAGMVSVFTVVYFGGIGLWIALVLNAFYRIGQDLGLM